VSISNSYTINKRYRKPYWTNCIFFIWFWKQAYRYRIYN